MPKFFIKSLIIFSICLINLLKSQVPSAKMNLEEISVKALGQSGKITINKSIKSSDGTIEDNEVTLDFSSLTELDINGTVIGKSGNFKHSFNNFAQLDFKVSEVTTVLYQKLTALTFNLQATGIQDDSTKFNGRLFIFNDTGKITNGDNENADIVPGTVKLSIDIENWKFCTEEGACPGINCCKNGQDREIGKYVEFVLAIKGKEIAKENGNNKKYSLGGSELILFENVEVDGKWNTLATGFPKYSMKGNTEEYAFRFPVFNSKLSYDPLFKYEEVKASSKIWIFIIIAAILVGGLGFLVVCISRKKKNAQQSENLMGE